MFRWSGWVGGVTAAGVGLDTPITCPVWGAACLACWLKVQDTADSDPIVFYGLADCVTVVVGSWDASAGATAAAPSKTVSTSIDSAVTCPKTLNKDNWLGGYTYADTYSVITSQIGLTTISTTITREDKTKGKTNIGWGMALSFQCCPA
jgi:hypothetical protein